MPLHRIRASNEIANGPTCTVIEYGVVGEADLAEAHISGRYPEAGFAINHESDMMIRVLSGLGVVATRQAGYELHPGSVIKVDKGTEYYYEGDHLRVVMIASPAWRPEQYEVRSDDSTT